MGFRRVFGCFGCLVALKRLWKGDFVVLAGGKHLPHFFYWQKSRQPKPIEKQRLSIMADALLRAMAKYSVGIGNMRGSV